MLQFLRNPDKFLDDSLFKYIKIYKFIKQIKYIYKYKYKYKI